jgi:hypothetical protein
LLHTKKVVEYHRELRHNTSLPLRTFGDLQPFWFFRIFISSFLLLFPYSHPHHSAQLPMPFWSKHFRQSVRNHFFRRTIFQSGFPILNTIPDEMIFMSLCLVHAWCWELLESAMALWLSQ